MCLGEMKPYLLCFALFWLLFKVGRERERGADNPCLCFSLFQCPQAKVFRPTSLPFFGSLNCGACVSRSNGWDASCFAGDLLHAPLSQDDCLFGSSGSPAGRHVIRFSVGWAPRVGWVGLS